MVVLSEIRLAVNLHAQLIAEELVLEIKTAAFDIGFVRSMYVEDYFMYNSDYVNKTDLSISNTNFVATVGCKF
ncbi:MAG: hypothetical protein IPJ32_12600 [Sphingobacteriaceae bacterium]|nr:hypothetical protein [Sphingobacteriaceae bacterium]